MVTEVIRTHDQNTGKMNTHEYIGAGQDISTVETIKIQTNSEFFSIKFGKIPIKSGKFRKIHINSRKFRKIPRNSDEFREIPSRMAVPSVSTMSPFSLVDD